MSINSMDLAENGIEKAEIESEEGKLFIKYGI